MTGAARKVEAVYELPFLAHAAMEPMNCTVHVREDSCDIWVGNQVVSRAQATAAQVTGLPPEKVQVHNHLIGGGFGRRLDVDGITQAVAIAKQVDGPVKVIWSREEDIQHDVYQPYYLRPDDRWAGCQGTPVAWHHRVTGSSILARWAPPAFKNGLDPDAIEGARKSRPMQLPNILVDYVRDEPPGLTTGQLARRRADAQYLRRRELHRRAGRSSEERSCRIPPRIARQSAARARRAQSRRREGRLGQSAADGVGRGVSVQFAMGTYLSQIAEVEVSKDGEVNVRRVVCAVDCGQIVNPDTIVAQIEGGIIFGISAALWGEITLKNGRVEQNNFNDYRVLRINETPHIEVHLVKSTEASGRHRRARHDRHRPGDGQCDLRRDRQAHPQAADQGSTPTRVG